MNKKILAFILAIGMVCTSVLGVAAAPNYTITVEPVGAESSVKVYGTFDDTVTEADGTIIFRLIKEETNQETGEVTRTDKVMDFTKTVVGEDGKISFDFGKIQILESITSGEYVVEVSGADLSELFTYDMLYAKPAELLEILKTIKSYTNSAEHDVAEAFTATNIKMVGVDDTEYKSFGADGKAAFEGIMDEKTYNVPETATGNEQQIAQEIDKVKGYYKEATGVGAFIEIKDAATLKAWYDKYYNEFGFAAEESTEESKRITPVVNSVLETADFANRISLASGKITVEQIRSYIYENALLSAVVKSATATDVKGVIEKFAFAPYFGGIDSRLYSLSASKQSSIFDTLKKQLRDYPTSYKSCADVVEKMNDLIEEKYTAGGDGGSGGGGGGGGGIGRPVYMENENVEEEVAETKPVFSDIEGVDWAIEAIQYLSEKKIVNGNPDGSFAPNKNVTRAEFIKMVMAAMGSKATEAGECFNDVAAEAWYAPYVNAAYFEGLVLGDEKGNFYPEAPITREDMTVILYRALKATEGGSVSFTDEAEISDYAKTAVEYFASNGIVNGLGDGRFGAKENATRAQTAVIIYRILTM